MLESQIRRLGANVADAVADGVGDQNLRFLDQTTMFTKREHRASYPVDVEAFLFTPDSSNSW
jgi:hypothetical protein